MPDRLNPGASHDVAQSLNAPVVAPSVQPNLGEPGDELSTGDLGAAMRFFACFDRRVNNQRVLDQFHADDSVKGSPADPRLTISETEGEAEATR